MNAVDGHLAGPHVAGRRARSDTGSITAFVAALTVGLILGAGLVYDGGRIISARNEAADLAENAARAGAQEIVDIRAGSWHLDPAAAASTANAFRRPGRRRPGERNDGVRDRLGAADRSTTFLGAIGVGPRTVTATRTAEAVDR
ncbi:MAG: pilus assembly protein TadG-related protein [Ilumatobacteraceae bacterium]